MRKSFLPFAKPSITDAELAAVRESLESGWISSGPKVEAFEAAFATRLGVSGAVALTSATAGFHLLFEALKLAPGDEVITTSLTWPSAINMLHLRGARPVFVDIDRDTLQMDVSAVEARIGARTRAILPVHFGGQPADLDPLRELGRRRDLLLIEDAAHAVGTEYRGKRIASAGNPCVFSFHAIKNLTTGEGGMITTNDAELCERLRSLRFHGVTKDAWKRHGEAAAYDLHEPGWKYNMPDLQAALGLAQLERLEEMQSRRTKLAAVYDALLDGIPGVQPTGRVDSPSTHGWHLYTVLVDIDRLSMSRDAFREELRKRNIGTGLHFLAVHELDFYAKHYPVEPGTLDNTEYVAKRIVSLPLFPGMTDEDVGDVVGAIREVTRA